MTNAALELLQSFKALTAFDQREVLLRLLREPIEADYLVPSDEELVQQADALFLELDKNENTA